MPDLILWHAPKSRSTRVLWLLHEIGCPFELRLLPAAERLDPPKPPALQDGETWMHETGAMIEWLCETRGQDLWRPPGGAGRIGWLDWLHFGETLLTRLDGPPDKLEAALDLLEGHFEDSAWLLGSFSGADCQLAISLWVIRREGRLGARQRISGYLDRCLIRAACREALETA